MCLLKSGARGIFFRPPSDSGGGHLFSLNIFKISYLITVTCNFFEQINLSGLNVTKEKNDKFSISGQVYISIPKSLCMKCFDFFNIKNRVGGEYGDAGPRPQVVFTNGILASYAVNGFIKLISKSYGESEPSLYLTYDSSDDEVRRHPLLDILSSKPCVHYPN